MTYRDVLNPWFSFVQMSMGDLISHPYFDVFQRHVNTLIVDY
jgi:hypothetical protein